MGRKSGLIVAVALLFALAGGLAYFAYKKLGRHNVAGLASVPRDAVAVVVVDGARVRAMPSVQRLRRWFFALPDIAHDWAPMVATCGFDPLDRIDNWVFAFDRSVVITGPDDSMINVFHVRGSNADAMRCTGAFLRMARSSNQLVPVAPIRNHPVYAVVGGSQTLENSRGRVSLLPDRAVMATANVLDRALAVLDHREPGADQNPVLRDAVGALGDNLLAFGVVDAGTLMAALGRDMRDVLAVFNMVSPGGNAMTILGGLVAASAGVQQTASGGLRVVAVTTHRSGSDAQAAFALINQSLALARAGIAIELVNEQNHYIDRVTQRGARDPSVLPQIPELRQLYALINALPDRVHVHVDGTMVRAEAELTASDVTTLENGFRAFGTCEESFDRQWQEEPAPPPPPPGPVPYAPPPSAVP